MHAFLSNLANRQTDKRTRAKTFTSSFVGGNSTENSLITSDKGGGKDSSNSAKDFALSRRPQLHSWIEARWRPLSTQKYILKSWICVMLMKERNDHRSTSGLRSIPKINHY